MKKKENVWAGGSPYFDEMTGKLKIPKLTRLSPGIYRNPLGDLVNAKNRAIRRPDGQQAASPPQGLMDALNGLNRMRGMSPQERLGAGIDPRDPNQYGMLPSGELVGTKIGWFDKEPEAQRALAAASMAAQDSSMPELLQRLLGRKR